MAATNGVFLTVAATGFVVAFFHAAIPTHWLPFVLASRAQRWSRAKTLAVTATAGGGHVLLTTLLGVFIVWLGIAIDERIGHLFPWFAGGALVIFGLYYVVRQLRGRGHGHTHQDHADYGIDHSHPHVYSHEPADHAQGSKTTVGEAMQHLRAMEQPKPTSDWVAIGSLLALLTFSPCEGFLPVYLSGIRYGWMGFALLSAILAGATLVGMVLFTWLTLIGLEKLKLQLLERYESGILGGALCLLGIFVILFEH